MLGFSTIDEALSQISQPEFASIRQGSIWVRKSNPDTTWWYVGFLVEQYHDGSWEVQVVVESDKAGRPRSQVWLREFERGFSLINLLVRI